MTDVFRKLLRGLAIVLGLLVAMLALPISSNAQSTYGSIVGTVTDATGAIVPGAAVTLTNIGTNEKRVAKSGAAGEYSFVNLLPANYKIEVAKAGFKAEVRQPINVLVGSTVRIDTAMQVGAATETVQVTSQAALLQTDSGTVNSSVEGETVQEMPVNGRNPVDLVALAPGVVANTGSTGVPALNQGDHSNQNAWNNFQIGGAISGQSSEYIDGVPNNVLNENSIAILPTQDAIQEFGVATNNVSADFGRFAGGVVNMSTKSGTNTWHGSAYEFLRNTDFNANDWMTKQGQLSQGQTNKAAPWNQNQFGVVANGPIKRDKAFFLFTWEQFRSNTSNSINAHVPSADMLAGYIPVQYDKNNVAIPISDPRGLCAINQVKAPGGEQSWYVPKSCWDSSTTVENQYFVAPSTTNLSSMNLSEVVPVTDNQNQYNGRVDYKLSDQQQLFARYTYWHFQDSSSCTFCSNKTFDTGNPAATWTNQQLALGDTYTINPKNILDVRIGWTRQKLYSAMQTVSDYSQFGGNAVALAKFFTVNILPLPQFGNGNDGVGIQVHFHWPGPNEQFQNNYSLGANWIRIMGRHTVKFGAELRQENEEVLGQSDSTDDQFNGNNTNDMYADFLLGLPSWTSIPLGGWTTGYNVYQGYYVQDNWTATKDLTLNLGLRWELPGAVAEANGKNTVLLPTTKDPLTGITGTLALTPGQLYSSKWDRNPAYSLFAPRIGFAYRLTNDTSVHGGYGISWLPIDVSGNLMPGISTINSAGSKTINPTIVPGMPICATYIATPTNCYSPANEAFGTTPAPLVPSGTKNFDGAGGTMAQIAQTGSSISAPIPGDPYSYNQQWNLAVGHQFKGNLMVELSYTGAKGTHLAAIGGGIDELPQSDWTTALATQANRPFPAYQNVSDANAMWGSTTYNAGIVRVEKRFHSGGLISANYTWAKTMGDTDEFTGFAELAGSSGPGANGIGIIQDSENHKGERSLMSFNVPSRVVASYVLPLPFGKGQKFASNANGLVNGLVSGWEFNGITMFQGGTPLFLSDGNGNSLSNKFGYAGLRPNYTAGCKKTLSGTTRARLNEWFNTGCFSAPGDLALGNEPRVDPSLTAQGEDNSDFALEKKTQIWERSSLEFRAEFFNAFNRTQFAPPSLDVSANGHGPGGSFGQVQSSGAHDPRKIQLSLRLKF